MTPEARVALVAALAPEDRAAILGLILAPLLAAPPVAVGDELTGPQSIVMRLRAHTSQVGLKEVPLTPRAFAVMRFLLERRGYVLSTDEISLRIWGYKTLGERNFLDAHISRLRAKLTKAGARGVIVTLRSMGYVIR